MLCWRSHDLTSCQIYSNTFLRGNHISNPQVPNTPNSKLLAVSNEGEIILMAEIRVDPHNLHLRPHHPSPPLLDQKFMVSNPEKAPTFPLYLPWLRHSRYILFHYIYIYSYKPGHATTTFFWEQKKDANQICPTLKPSGRYTTARSKPFAKTSGARKPSGCFAMSRANLASHSWKTFWLR